MPATSSTASNSFYNSSTKTLTLRVSTQYGTNPNINYYLVNSSGVAVRGPVTVTGQGPATKYFYDVPAGTYKIRMVNNGSYTVDAEGSLTY